MLEELKQKVYEANMELPRRGLITYTWGNVSGIDREKGLFVIKPSGVDYDVLKPSDMVVMDLEGNKVEVLWRVKNTGDKTMHFQIGAHPAFLYPNYEVDQPDRGYFAFDVEKDLVYRALVEKGA